MKMSCVVTFILLWKLLDSSSLRRKRRFASLMDFWNPREIEDYALPEQVMKFAEPKAEYDKLNKYDYLGRPSPIMQRLLKWDYQYEELGPTVSRLISLLKSILTDSDVLQSMVSKSLGYSIVYDEWLNYATLFMQLLLFTHWPFQRVVK